jgi:hypothetical protein
MLSPLVAAIVFSWAVRLLLIADTRVPERPPPAHTRCATKRRPPMSCCAIRSALSGRHENPETGRAQRRRPCCGGQHGHRPPDLTCSPARSQHHRRPKPDPVRRPAKCEQRREACHDRRCPDVALDELLYTQLCMFPILGSSQSWELFVAVGGAGNEDERARRAGRLVRRREHPPFRVLGLFVFARRGGSKGVWQWPKSFRCV